MPTERRSHVATVDAFYEAVAQRDDGALRELVSGDLVWHVPGRNPVSGDYEGVEEVFTTMRERMAPLDEWRFEVHDVLENETGGVVLALIRLIGRRKGKRVDQDGAHLFRLNQEGRIVEAWGFAHDQAALDEFFS